MRLNTLKTMLLVSVIAIVIHLVISTVSAQSPAIAPSDHHHGRHGRMHGGMRGYFLRQLDLTASQQAQLQQIHENHRANIDSLRSELQSKKAEIRQMARDGSFSEALMTQKLIEMAPLKAKLMAEHLNIRQEFLSILTPEQKEKLEHHRQQFEQKRKEHSGRDF